MAEQLTAQQRANLFAMSTRENMHMLAKQKVTSGGTSIDFNLPKARLLSNIFVRVKAKVNVKHATKTSLKNDFLTPYRIIRRWNLDLNNGFSPFAISGEGLMLLNLLQPNAKMVLNRSDYFDCAKSFTASTSGTDNEFFFTVQLPVTLNNRDAVGLVLLQSDQTVVNLRADIANAVDMYPNLEEGYTVELKELEVEPMLQTFSIPANSSAFPDLSVLKLCNDRQEVLTSQGQHVIKLPTGTIYRKLIFYITDENGNPATPDFITSNFELLFNTADCNYSISPAMLRAVNSFNLDTELPSGVYVFDFSSQGFSNFGGVRDYIDTEKLTQFELRMNSSGKGKVKVISECLARLV